MTQQLEKSKKAVLSNRIFLDLENSKIDEIDRELTYRIPSPNPLMPRPTIIRNCRKITKNVISIPSGRLDLIPKELEVIDKRILKPVDFPEPKWPLSEFQLPAAIDLCDSGILNAPVGWGKTFTSLHVAKNLGQKTLVVVHNISLRDQWQKETKKLFGFEPGVIGSGSIYIHPLITIANVQTLVNCMDRVQEEFGTLILDEAHHVPATTFSTVVDKMKCRYKIGLTGTLKRKDGKHVIFQDYFGPILVKPKSTNVMVPKVQIVKSNVQLPPGSCWSDKVTALLDDQEYIELIAMIANAKADIGHKVLVLASRTKFQQKLADILGDRCIVVNGATPLPGRTEAHRQLKDDEKDILVGPTSIYKEGISESYLSCLICADPINNEGLLEQLMGRVMRIDEDKLQPIVVDIQLKRTPSSNTVYRQAASRIATYMKLGYEIEQL